MNIRTAKRAEHHEHGQGVNIIRHMRVTCVILALVSAVAACKDKVPEGQVVAVVDGEEVTRRELAAEPQADGAGQGSGAQPALGALLSGVVDRKLAAAEAERLELDRTPQYVAQAKRVDEIMLSRTLFDRWAAETPEPSKEALKEVIARNPQRFDGRKLLLVDRVVTGAEGLENQALAPLQSNDAVAAYLDRQSKLYRRDRTVIDTATLPLALYRKLVSLAPGYPLALVQSGTVSVLAVVETRDAPLPPAEKAAVAIKTLKQAAVQEKLAALRKNAKIAYQPGYRPPPPSASRGGMADASN